jgi:hypothetical protein
MSSRIVWDPSDFTFYGVMVSREYVNDMLGDFPNDDWMIVVYGG